MTDKVKINDLTCYVEGDLNNKEATYVVLLHGYGANGLDLLPLSQEIASQQETVWVFPEAPKSIPIGMGVMGKAWFDVDLMAVQMAAQNGSLLDYYEAQHSKLDAPREKVLGLIKQLKIKSQNLVLGGFSQGAMLALDCALHLEETPKALLLYSPTFYSPTVWPQKAPQKSGLKFLLSHGLMDPVLPYDLSKGLFDMLKKSGLKGEMISYQGGHEIPYPVIQASSRYI